MSKLRLDMRLVLLAAVLILEGFRLEELSKELTGIRPVFPYDAVFYFGRFNLSLYESCVLQFFKVLAYRGLCYG